MVTYNRQEVGKRLGCRRREMGLTGEEWGEESERMDGIIVTLKMADVECLLRH